MADTWQDGFKRAILDFLKAPADVDLSTVRIEFTASEEAYSEYTGGSYEDLTIRWSDPDGRPRWGTLDGSEMVTFFRSLNP